MQTIESIWETFASEVLADDVDEMTKMLLRRIFYGGATATLDIIFSIRTREEFNALIEEVCAYSDSPSTSQDKEIS